MNALQFLREHRKAALGLAVFEIIFFIILFEIPRLFLLRLTSALSAVPAGSIAPARSLEGVQAMNSALQKLLFGLAGNILLFLLIAALCFAFFRSLLWHLTLRKPLGFREIHRSFSATLLIFLLALIPLIFAFRPIIAATRQNLLPTAADAFPLIILVSIIVYLVSLSYLFVAKGSSAWKAIVAAFKHSLDPALALPTLALMSSYVLLFLFRGALGNALPVLVILATLCISFWGRLYIIERA